MSDLLGGSIEERVGKGCASLHASGHEGEDPFVSETADADLDGAHGTSPSQDDSDRLAWVMSQAIEIFGDGVGVARESEDDKDEGDD